MRYRYTLQRANGFPFCVLTARQVREWWGTIDRFIRPYRPSQCVQLYSGQSHDTTTQHDKHTSFQLWCGTVGANWWSCRRLSSWHGWFPWLPELACILHQTAESVNTPLHNVRTTPTILYGSDTGRVNWYYRSSGMSWQRTLAPLDWRQEVWYAPKEGRTVRSEATNAWVLLHHYKTNWFNTHYIKYVYTNQKLLILILILSVWCKTLVRST